MMRIAYLLALAAIVSGPASAADLAAGQAKAKAVCASCHREDGQGQSPEFPKLAGQHVDYLVKSLNDYKTGARNNAIMKGFASGLSKKEIEDVAAWYASQNGLSMKY